VLLEGYCLLLLLWVLVLAQHRRPTRAEDRSHTNRRV
jgi:hypothetical protein